jgi:hypothetical protein
MSRVVNTDNPGKLRNQMMRTAAEILRHLSQKAALDDETKDMTAQLVYCLRGVEDGIEASAMAWEKRDYWIKAEQLRQRWTWAGNSSARLENLIRNEQWDALPAMMVSLFEYFADIKITKLTRNASAWEGAYQRLKSEVRS